MGALSGISGISGLAIYGEGSGGGGGEPDYHNASYITIMGSWPDPRTLDFLGKVDFLVNTRLTNVPLSRSTTVHFSQLGNDTAGTGAVGTPYKTIAKAQAVVNAIGANGDLALLFKRGEVWRETPGLATNKRTTVHVYGSGAKPVFTGFTIQYPVSGGGWLVHSGVCYKRTSVPSIAWLKFANAPDALGRPLWKVADAATCVATPDSFAWVASELFVNIGINPDTVAMEATTGRVAAGPDFVMYGDNVRAQSIRFEAWGLRSNGSDTPTYGMQHATAAQTEEGVFEDCEVYYTGYHAIGAIGSDVGGITTVKGCTVGYCRLHAGNSTAVVAFAQNGGNEIIWDNHTTLAGSLWEGGSERTCESIYGHSNGPAARLTIVRNHTIVAGKWAASAAAGATNMPVAATHMDARLIIINETFNGPSYSETQTLSVQGGPTYGIHIDCKYRAHPINGVNAIGSIGTGWAINTTYSTGVVVAGYRSLFSSPSPNVPGEWWHCRLHFPNYGAIYAAGTDSAPLAGWKLRNCIITCLNSDGYPTECVPNIYQETVANITGNAWLAPDPVIASSFGAPTGTSGVGPNDDPAKILLAANRPWDWQPPIDSSVANAGANVGVEYDCTGAARAGDTTLGPYKAGAALDWDVLDVPAGIGVCALELRHDLKFTNTACTLPSANDGTDNVAGWKGTPGGNWIQGTAGNQPLSTAKGLQGGGTGKYLNGSLSVTNWVVYAVVERTNAADLCFIFGATTGGVGNEQCLVLYGTSAYIIDGASVRLVACSKVGRGLYRFSAYTGHSYLMATAFNSAELLAGGGVAGAGTLTVDRILARPASDGTSATAWVDAIWVWTGASTFIGSQDEANFLEYVKAMTGTRLL